MHRLILNVCVCLCLSFSSSASAQITLEPGTLLGCNTEMQISTLIKYNTSGVVLGSVTINNTIGLDVVVGVAVIGTDVYVAGFSTAPGTTTSICAQVDLATGNILNSFPIPYCTEGLGNRGDELLTMDWPSTVYRYSTDGTQLGSFPLTIDPEGTGIESDGFSLYAGAFNDGSIQIYDLAGVSTGTIATALVYGDISAIALDPTTDTFWIATGYGSDQLVNVNMAGTILQSTPLAASFLTGLHFVKQSMVRGDCNADSLFNLADAVFILGVLFQGGGPAACASACDANDDGSNNLADAIYMLTSLFSGGPSPAYPSSGCAADPTFDTLGCAMFPGCP